jgi:type II secretory pathway component PulF
MALYRYEAFSKEGKRVYGTLDAPSAGQIKEQLLRQQLFPISIELAPLESGGGLLSSFFAKKVTSKDKILFTKQLAVLLKAGVPLLQSIELLVDQFTGQFRQMLIAIKDDLRQGSSLAIGLAKYPKTFETIYVQLVRAGEASGQLEPILDRLTDYLERTEALAKRVKGALQGPLIQLGVILLVVVGMVVFIIPSLAENFASAGKALPAPTQFLMNLSYVIKHYYPILLTCLIFFIIWFKYWSSTKKGARTLDTIKINLPVVKYLAKTNAVVQCSYTLGMLLEGGVNLAEALDIVVSIIDNRILADALQVAREKIVKQGKIAEYLKQTHVFPPIAIYLIETGEQSGQLDSMLLGVAKTYEAEVNELTDRLTGIVGPAMTIFTALVVGFIVAAIMMPIIQMNDLVGV